MAILNRNLLSQIKFQSTKKDGFSDLNSDFIMNYVGLPSEPKPHRAINGARYEAEALSRLIYGRGLFEEFEGYAIPTYLQK